MKNELEYIKFELETFTNSLEGLRKRVKELDEKNNQTVKPKEPWRAKYFKINGNYYKVIESSVKGIPGRDKCTAVIIAKDGKSVYVYLEVFVDRDESIEVVITEKEFKEFRDYALWLAKQ